MQRCFVLLFCFFLAAAAGCNESPKGDPAFKKEKVDPDSNKPVKGEKMQDAPPA